MERDGDRSLPLPSETRTCGSGGHHVVRLSATGRFGPGEFPKGLAAGRKGSALIGTAAATATATPSAARSSVMPEVTAVWNDMGVDPKINKESIRPVMLELGAKIITLEESFKMLQEMEIGDEEEEDNVSMLDDQVGDANDSENLEEVVFSPSLSSITTQAPPMQQKWAQSKPKERALGLT